MEGMRDACKALLFLILVASAGSQPPWNPQCFPGTTVCAVEGQQVCSSLSHHVGSTMAGGSSGWDQHSRGPHAGSNDDT